jgi:secreted trypsin-like serine protease
MAHTITTSKKWKLGVLIASLGLSVAAVQAQDINNNYDNYIIGGSVVAPTDPIARSTVMISGTVMENGAPDQYICSGSIIAQDLILTAAHCIAEDPSKPVPANQMKIIFGTHANQPGAAVRQVVSYVVNPGWTYAIQQADAHDIALIRIQGAIPPGFAPAILPTSALNLSPGTTTILAGYGVTNGQHPSFATTGTLRKVAVSIIGQYGSTEVEVDGSHHKGSCGGDSGGPAFVLQNGNYVLWGLTSRGDEACVMDGIYTRVDAYFDFLNRASAQLHQAQ